MIAGEITTRATIDYPTVVRKVIRDVGYIDDEWGINADTCAVMVALGKQSPDIAQGVNENATAGKDIGAGDQGLMFGYANNDTPELMPLPIALAHRILLRLTEARKRGEVDWLRPDSKSQVTVEFDGHRAVRVDTVVVSTQHAPNATHEKIRRYVIDKIIRPCLPEDLVNGDITYHINPTGRFVVGGPQGDCGLTGRKIIVDTYGGWGRHGGGAFSGKDPTKVDRSAAYMARHVAKNIVAAGLADRCELQFAYAIGVSRAGERARRYRGDRPDRRRADLRAGEGTLPAHPERDHQVSRSAAADLSPHGGRWPLWPQRAGIHLGKHLQGGGACRGSRSWCELECAAVG